MPMTILCEKCGAKNPLGEIYCKSCGSKLNVEAIQQKLQERKESFTFDDFKYYLGIVRKLVVWALLLGVVAILVGLFLPVPMEGRSDMGNAQKRLTVNKYREVMDECAGAVANPKKEHEFSQEEVTMLANWMTGLDEADQEDPGFALSPQELSVRFLSTQYVRLVLRSRAMKKLNVYSTLVGKFVEDDQGFRFVAVSAKVGKVRLPGIKDIVFKRFKPLFKDIDQLKKLSRNLEAVDVYNGQVVIKIEKSNKARSR